MKYLLLALLVPFTANAASTGTLLLSGVVPVVANITVTPNGTNNTTLNITGGETAKNVASVLEQSNNASGYKIFLYSANVGELRHTVTPTIKTTYTISYNGASAITPGSSASPTQVKNVASLTSLSNNTSQVTVNVTALPSAAAGTYTDTVTFSIVSNP